MKNKESVETQLRKYEKRMLNKLKQLLEQYENNIIQGMQKVIKEEREALKYEMLALLHNAVKDKH